MNQDSIKILYHRVIDGNVKAAWNGKVVSERKIYLDKYEGLEVSYTRFFDGRSEVPVTSRIIVVDGTLFTFDIFDLQKGGQKSLKEKFIGSILMK
jgi:hypothetical protein